jgi:serine O-acetyltransferase
MQCATAIVCHRVFFYTMGAMLNGGNAQRKGRMSVNSDDAEQHRISAVDADWSRERKRLFEWAPSRSLLACIRSYQRHQSSRNPLRSLQRALAVFRHRCWSVVTGADIPLNCKLGGGLLLPHPNGIVIHPEVEIGPNCLLFQQVTLGANDRGVPTIGGHVDIGAGAKVLGPVTIGQHARIGANAVVITDIPIGATAAGVPARVISS